MRVLRLAVTLAFASTLSVSPSLAQGPPPRPVEQGQVLDRPMTKDAERVDIILPHISDADEVDVPWPNAKGYRVWHLPRWEPVKIGAFAVNLSPSKHVVMMILAAVIGLIVLITAARAQARHVVKGESPKGLSGAVEWGVLTLRRELILPAVGPHGEKFVPYLLSIFFFILFANLLGLAPYGATATGNVSVTAMLAITAFVVIEGAGMAALGKNYISTVVYWPHDMPLYGKILMTSIMTPVEIIGKFTKPFALCIRLFANMTAGHVMVLALISLIFAFGSLFVGLFPVLAAVAILFLETFVAGLQAYVFTLLVASFIGQIRTAEGH